MLETRIINGKSQRETRRNALKTAIKAVYNTNRGIYGYRRIAAFLRFI
ncbi:IS3 family transposase, partial [Weissella confusa]